MKWKLILGYFYLYQIWNSKNRSALFWFKCWIMNLGYEFYTFCLLYCQQNWQQKDTNLQQKYFILLFRVQENFKRCLPRVRLSVFPCFNFWKDFFFFWKGRHLLNFSHDVAALENCFFFNFREEYLPSRLNLFNTVMCLLNFLQSMLFSNSIDNTYAFRGWKRALFPAAVGLFSAAH